MSGARVRVDAAALVRAASEARHNAYAPYSKYRVGAAIVTRRGGIYAGCNVENATYGATLCAERSAIAAMVAAGDEAPIAGAVVSAGPEPATPCGICRQVLIEFAAEMRLWLVAEGPSGKVLSKRATTLAKLLPGAFKLGKQR
jgi:cytidine deaminase